MRKKKKEVRSKKKEGMVRTWVLAVMLFFLAMPVTAQSIGDFQMDETNLYAMTKQMGQFIRRFNYEEDQFGYKINHKRVQRIMHEAGFEGKRPKEKYHSYRGEVGKVADNLINRDFHTSKPLQKWTTDISQFSFPWGKCYLSPILDTKCIPNGIFFRRITGYEKISAGII